MPVVQIEAGKIVVDSFVYAFIFHFCNILIFINNFSKNLLCIAMHRFFANALTLLIFLMIIFKINLNFANMISLILFSLGISYPIYFLRRYSEMKGTIKVFNSNTPLAILTSSLTTIASFGTLYLSSHDGTSSMGLLLFLSLLTTLISSLVFLPIFTSFIKSR